MVVIVICDAVGGVERIMNAIGLRKRRGCMLDVVAFMILLLGMCRLRVFRLVIAYSSN